MESLLWLLAVWSGKKNNVSGVEELLYRDVVHGYYRADLTDS